MSSTEKKAEPTLVSGETSDPGPVFPPLTRRAKELEVLAVLVIGILPPLRDALIVLFWEPRPQLGYGLESVTHIFHGAFAIFLILYLISRSGESWKHFGISEPRILDILLGLVLFLVAESLWHFQSRVFQLKLEYWEPFISLPQKTIDYFLMILKYGVMGFEEELVARAYLITRLEQLLGSSMKAIVLAAAAFASFHIYYGLAGLLYPFLFGIVFGFIFLNVRRIWPFALGHMMYNIRCELSYIF
jgi:membrane protease YdiL (CAAX protease family)